MNQPAPRRGSLLERAAEIYDFEAALRGRGQRAPDYSDYDAEVAAEPDMVAEPEAAWPENVVPQVSPVADRMPIETGSRRYGTIDREKLSECGYLVPGAPVNALAEEYRIVKRQLLLGAVGGRGAKTAKDRMILVCSAKPNEGKTFTAVNLALSMAAEQDVEVLLVDADFAKPEIVEALGLPAGPGLLDALADPTVDVEACVIATDIPQLTILPAGDRSTSDTELLASDRTEALLQGLVAANPRRIVIFDSPPALAASPASVLALNVGQVLMVVRADKTIESDLREAVSLLDGCENIQLMLNGVGFAPGGRRFGPYYEQARA